MCIAFFSYHQLPKFPFILAFNRDEFYERPTAPADFWQDDSTLLAGRDLKAGGTWLGTNRCHDIAFLTNFRDKKNNNETAKSRGALVHKFLSARPSLESYIQDLQVNKNEFNGYNLFFGNLKNKLFYYSNVTDQSVKLSPGIYAISNGTLNTPWPKTVRGLSLFKNLIHPQSDTLPIEKIFDMMTDSVKSKDTDLPETGYKIELERVLSSIFIKSAAFNYGTRSTTIIYMTDDGQLSLIERTHASDSRYTTVNFTI